MTAPVAMLTPRYVPEIGGVERHVQALVAGLAGQGVPVEVLTTDPSGRLPRVERVDGTLVRRFPTLAGESRYFASPWLLRWLWWHADRYRLLHAHNYQSLVPLAAGVGAWRTDLPLVVTTHYHAAAHTPLSALLHVPYRPVAARVLRSAAAVIAVSEAERGWLARDFGQLPLHVLHNGVDVAPPDAAGAIPSDGQATGEVRILSVGRLEPYKGVDRIVGALAFLPPSVTLTIVGRGSAQDAIAAVAVDLGVADRVRLLGHVSAAELHALYASADLFVTLSREEAFGMTVLEAAAGGAPVLASDIPAHREVQGFVPGGRITLVAQDAAGDALARAMSEAWSLGRSADRTGWRLPTWTAMADGVRRIYAEVLGEPVA